MATALGRVGGDEELLKEIAEIFLEQCPEELAEIRRAIEAQNPEAVQEAAHSLKGAVGNFGAKTAFDAAYRLELMGRKGNLSGSGEALTELEKALADLNPELSKLANS
jgi:HPt (histidine-containing phosphotransfer) domain-containing protein